MAHVIQIKTKNINNKRLFVDINKFIAEDILSQSSSIMWSSDIHKESLVEIIEDWLFEFISKNRIIQFDVICDERNNNTDLQELGKYYLTIKYKQTHCLNITEILYEITDDSSTSG